MSAEVVCTGDWRNTDAPNLDLQLVSDRLGLCLSLYGYEDWQIRRSGGAKWLFRSQNRQLLENRQNVTQMEAENCQQMGEKTVYRTAYRASYQNTPCIYRFSMVYFPKKGTCVWMMLNGVAKKMEEHGAVFDQLIQDLVCLDPDLEPEEETGGPSLAEQVGAALGLEYEILPPQTSDKELLRIWNMAARPGVQPLLLLPDECFFNAAPLPEYPPAGGSRLAGRGRVSAKTAGGTERRFRTQSGGSGSVAKHHDARYQRTNDCGEPKIVCALG